MFEHGTRPSLALKGSRRDRAFRPGRRAARDEITRDAGRVLTFEAYRVDQVRKDTFPTKRVYGNTTGPELRLITCSGEFVGGHLGSADNIVVYLRQRT